MLPWMATGAVPVRIRTATHFSLENSHRETSHRGRTFHPPWAFVGFTATLRYEPCIQFINVSQKMLHIYFIDGCRRIKSKTKTATCEQAPRSLFLFCLCMARNFQFIQSQSVSDIHSSFLFGSSMPDSPNKSDPLGYPDPAYAELRVEAIALHQPNW